jgi:lipoate-protein ligase B
VAVDIFSLQTTPLRVRFLNLQPYEGVWTLQRELQQKRIRGEIADTLLMCSHDPVITVGKSGSRENIIASEESLLRRGIQIFDVERGGDVTYHGPEQLILYPIIDLTQKRRDVDWFLRSLEQVILDSLTKYSIVGERYPGRTGIWVKNHSITEFRKIASIGVRLSRWCSLHGMSLNVFNCTNGFSAIHPCGLHGVQVTSMEQETSLPFSWNEISRVVAEQFCEVFHCEVSNLDETRSN